MTRAARIREATTIGVSVDAFAVTDAGLQPALRCMELRTRAGTVCHSSPREHIPAADTSPTGIGVDTRATPSGWRSHEASPLNPRAAGDGRPGCV
jgi:hypothetical protein